MVTGDARAVRADRTGAGVDGRLATAEKMVLDYIRELVPHPKTAPLAGNSIATDRGFITRDMPTLDTTCTTG